MHYVDLAQKYHSDIDRTVAGTLRTLAESGVSPPCRKGCAWCCRLPVNATAPEGALAAIYIEEKFKAKDKGVLIERMRGWLAWYRESGLRSERVECPFLKSDTCSIYDVRPMGCRVHYSKDADGCRRAMQGLLLFYEPPLLDEVLDAVKPLCMEYRRKLELSGVCFEDCVKPMPELVLMHLKDIDSQT